MSDPIAYYRTFIANINTFIGALEQLTLMQDRMSQDPTLAAAAAQAANAAGRTDLATVDFNNAGNAIGQINFTYNSGSPTEKSYLYKLL